MSKIIENFLVPLFLVISVFYAFHSFSFAGHSFSNAGQENIFLNKVYHHMAPQEGYLEKANISLYFSGDPHIQEVKTKKAYDVTSCAFFFPRAQINQSDAQTMVNSINNYHGNYKVSIAQVTKPTAGIIIKFDYDPRLFMVNYEQFDSIGLQKGFVFRLYNKELLHKLEQANNQPVLRTLHNRGKHSKKPLIVIDPGHGGKDSGAIGSGIQEKNVCLAISTTVGNLLQQEGYSVMLTRNTDCDMPLDRRTSYANDTHADLFISIHANYASSSQAIGVETFCLQQQLFKQQQDLPSSLSSYISNVVKPRAALSCKLAHTVQASVCDCISSYHDESIDRKVKHSVSQVLLGVQMPAILIEVGFLSHPQEVQLLNDVHYQNSIAQGICQGILSFSSHCFL